MTLDLLGVATLAQANDPGSSDITLGTIVLYIVIGAVIGVLARFLVPGDDPMGIVWTIVLGIVGALIGGWLAGEIFAETEGIDWIASIVVAVVLVLLYRVTRRGTVRS